MLTLSDESLRFVLREFANVVLMLCCVVFCTCNVDENVVLGGNRV